MARISRRQLTIGEVADRSGRVAHLRIGALLDRAITLVVRNWRSVLPLIAARTILQLALRIPFPHAEVVRDDIIEGVLDLAFIPAYFAIFAGRATSAMSALRWAATRMRTIIACSLVYWVFCGAPNDIVQEFAKHAIGRDGFLFVIYVLNMVLFAPLEIATGLVYPEVLLEPNSLGGAIRIAWQRGVTSNVGRAWRYGSIVGLTLIFTMLLAGGLGEALNSLTHTSSFVTPLLESSLSLVYALNSAFMLALADALRAHCAGSDLEAAIDASR